MRHPRPRGPKTCSHSVDITPKPSELTKPSRARVNTPQPQCNTFPNVAQVIWTRLAAAVPPRDPQALQKLAKPIEMPTAVPTNPQTTVENQSPASIDDTSRRQQQPERTTSKSMDRTRSSRVFKNVSRSRQHDRR